MLSLAAVSEQTSTDRGEGAVTSLGWIGAGRMGSALAARLLRAGCDVAIYNRTRTKAEDLTALGATVVDAPAALAYRQIVFTMVAGPDDFRQVTTGADGLFSNPASCPAVLVDSTTISPATSGEVRAVAAERGTALLAAPVSGNPKVALAGRLTLAVSGPRDAYELALPYLQMLGCGVTYVGSREEARLVKICHNLMLGVVAQSLAEITVLAEKGGVSRAAFLTFLNHSVLGSTFTRYKSPAYVNLDYSVTFTPALLRKDLELGLDAARDLDVPLPLAAATCQIVQAMIGSGLSEIDFAALLELQARLSGLQLQPENVILDDGLTPDDSPTDRVGL